MRAILLLSLAPLVVGWTTPVVRKVSFRLWMDFAVSFGWFGT